MILRHFSFFHIITHPHPSNPTTKLTFQLNLVHSFLSFLLSLSPCSTHMQQNSNWGFLVVPLNTRNELLFCLCCMDTRRKKTQHRISCKPLLAVSWIFDDALSSQAWFSLLSGKSASSTRIKISTFSSQHYEVAVERWLWLCSVGNPFVQ